ncbi:TetR/AcrR family transcriptional regulator [Piscinibacter sakaiensis]|uniref:Transcriptional regulator NfxB n=1 Tax=Piscinibacter sakaiensis TaxID=1547922 RepID=A0A0K8NUJ1_PISS1|nr:TetR/AcrR family transcriptional regulator [Piscinibacter sakaiensis]GAP34066.1 transcriptional regulator NfxB [Piscinibacter sakaiensis]
MRSDDDTPSAADDAGPLAEQGDDARLLAALALALVDKPRATLHELAQAVGVSKATLYRHSRTREELIDRLTRHATGCLQRALEEAQLDEGPARAALTRFVQAQLEQRDMAAFLVYQWQPQSIQSEGCGSSCDAYLGALDRFILRGQREGVFRIDISAQAQAEALIALLTGLVDAERRGRVARAGVAAAVEALFLNGSAA